MSKEGKSSAGLSACDNSFILNILITDCHAESRGTNLPYSPFDCHVKIKHVGGHQIFLIDVFSQTMTCKLISRLNFLKINKKLPRASEPLNCSTYYS